MRAFNWLETRVPDGARDAAQRCRAFGRAAARGASAGGGGVAIYPSRRFQAMKAKTFLDFLIASLPITRGGLLEPGAVGLLTSPA